MGPVVATEKSQMGDGGSGGERGGGEESNGGGGREKDGKREQRSVGVGLMDLLHVGRSIAHGEGLEQPPESPWVGSGCSKQTLKELKLLRGRTLPCQ